MKMLIVDDLWENRKLLQGILKPYGRCDTGANGMEGLELFKNALEEGEPYRLVLLDIMMPHMDGQETLRQMRQLEHQQRQDGPLESAILMVTALGDPGEALKAFFHGYCTDYLIKPVTQPRLLAKLVEMGVLTTQQIAATHD
ncbi:MAG: response regulator [Magnetococcales bacterium]|nr:response regulator [Magnetococcales bacterium]